MKTYYLLLLLLLSFFFGKAQDSAMVAWEMKSPKGSGHILSFKATIQNNWRLFSTAANDEEPNTRIVLDSATTEFASIKGIEEKGNLQVVKEPLFDNATIRFFENEVELLVEIDLKEKKKDIRGSILYMAMKGDVVTSPVEVPFKFSFDPSGKLVAGQGGLAESTQASKSLKRTNIDTGNPVNTCGGTGIEDSRAKSLLGVFILGFLGGLIGLLTPCVFPMIPLTVSFFTKKAQSRKKGFLTPACMEYSFY
jgi:thiol:disulfide interchange protein DsbD